MNDNDVKVIGMVLATIVVLAIVTVAGVVFA